MQTWIEKKSIVKKKLGYNKKEMQNTGGGKPTFNTLSELEERIAGITNVREITAIFDDSICVGIKQSSADKRYELNLPGPSHHCKAV